MGCTNSESYLKSTYDVSKAPECSKKVLLAKSGFEKNEWR